MFAAARREAARSRIAGEGGRRLEQIFRILSLALERESLMLAFRALRSGEERARGTALEYLDNILPDINGIDVCQELRNQEVDTPVLMLTGKHEVEEKVRALDSGADDYLTKPYSLAELLARIRALLRRSSDSILSNQIQVGDLVIDVSTREVKRKGKEIKLRRKEFALLEYLMSRRARF